MNCKKDDLAIVVRSFTGENLGKIVRCLRLANPEDLWLHNVGYDGPVWLIDQTLICRSLANLNYFAEVPLVPDEILRPIRDPGEDATDEMVQLLGKPQEVTA